MTFLAKTVLIYASEEDMVKIKDNIDWRNFLSILGGTDAQDDSVLQGLTVTRYWTDRAKAELYKEWSMTNFANENVTPVSFTIEDIPQ